MISLRNRKCNPFAKNLQRDPSGTIGGHWDNRSPCRAHKKRAHSGCTHFRERKSLSQKQAQALRAVRYLSQCKPWDLVSRNHPFRSSEACPCSIQSCLRQARSRYILCLLACIQDLYFSAVLSSRMEKAGATPAPGIQPPKHAPLHPFADPDSAHLTL